MISKPLSSSQYSSNGSNATRYQEALWGESGAAALEYLTQERGLDEAVIGEFGLGYVDDPALGHESYQGRISIPYWNARGVTTIRFRGLPGREGNAKYLDLPGAPQPFYNVTQLLDGGSVIYVCEGEIDTVTAVQMGLPAIGLSGTQKWKDYRRNMLNGYGTIIVLCDNDDGGVGMDLGNLIAAEMTGVDVLLKPAPKGHDVNSAYREMGRDALLDYWKVKANG